MFDPNSQDDPIKARFLEFLESGIAYKNSDLKKSTDRKDMDKFKKRIMDQFDWRKEPYMKSLKYNFTSFVECYQDPRTKDLLIDVIKTDRPGFKRKHYDRLAAQGITPTTASSPTKKGKSQSSVQPSSSSSFSSSSSSSSMLSLQSSQNHTMKAAGVLASIPVTVATTATTINATTTDKSIESIRKVSIASSQIVDNKSNINHPSIVDIDASIIASV